MLRALASHRIIAASLLLALPLAATGCQSTGGGWGWSPSLSSMNPWRSSANNSQLASSKPSKQVPTPPAPLLAGNGLASSGARNSTASTAPTGDYGNRQVSATRGDGYPTGRYNTGNSTAQQGPYGEENPGYGGAVASTADRRSDPAYGSSNNGWQNYNSQQQYNQPTVNQPTSNAPPSSPYQAGPGGQYQGVAAPQNSTYSAGVNSSYAGATGLSAGSKSSAPAGASYGGDAYRPGSTASGSDEVQRTSYDDQPEYSSGSGGLYPTTSAGDDSEYR